MEKKIDISTREFWKDLPDEDFLKLMEGIDDDATPRRQELAEV